MEANNDFSYKPVNNSTLKFYKSYICDDYKITQRRRLNIKDDMSTTESKLLAKHVSDANGGIKVYPVNPAFVTSTNNTTIYINDSEDANNKDSILLALCDVDDSLRNIQSKNYFISSSKSGGMGIRIRLTCLFAADGSTTPIYIIILGMKESEMPSSIYPYGIYVEEVPGLSSASDVDGLVEIIGYIVFVRGDKNNISNGNGNIDALDKINEDSDNENMLDL
eukprot:12894074-Ditylum_brightwellii.AAC.1